MNRVVFESDTIYHQNPFVQPNTLYVIKVDLKIQVGLGQPLEIGANSILKFEGGSIKPYPSFYGYPVPVTSTGSEIIAPSYHILKSCTLSDGFVNNYLPVEWFGAKGDGVTDDSDAINMAIDSCHGSTVLLSNATYVVDLPINIKRDHINFECRGTIKIMNHDVIAFDIASSESTISINRLIGYYDVDAQGHAFNYQGGAILLSDNCHNSTFNVHVIRYFDKGIMLMPRTNSRDYAGIQYCKFSFSYITANYCIYIDMVNDVESGSGVNLWVNENQFNGGRLQGTNGIYVAADADPSQTTWGWINGNVFNCIGFEDIVFPIQLYHCAFNSFHDLRMSESIYQSPDEPGLVFISLRYCKNMTFDIKSFFPRTYLKAEHSHHIELKRCFCDEDYGVGQDYSRLLVLNEDGSALTGASYNFVSSAMTSRNDFKRIYFGLASQDLPNLTIPYHELFQTIDDGETRILSSQCQIVIDDHLEVTLELYNHLLRIHSEMIIHLFSADNLGKLIFNIIDPNPSQQPTNNSNNAQIKVIGQPAGINYVQRTGCYRICHDYHDKVYVIPISFNDQTIS